jgi:hypothetical protein
MRRFIALIAAVVASAALQACDSPLAGEGQPCATSEECVPGLLCDFGQTPHVCSKNLSAKSDLSVRLDMTTTD